ncbi:MAG: hypothetical protein KF802_06545 [Bdellovibrionaceae bacterium]|nr:hypothetical protein [Pseudobdellovibrionaceae bacterium]
MRTSLFALLLSVFIFSSARAQTNSVPTYKMDGMASLMTNYVDYGLSHTTQDPALHAAFWFNWGPQFRMGLWGSNVSYKDSDSHFLLKVSADLRIQFSENSDLTIKYSDNHYFKPESRDGNVLGLHLNLFTYGIRYEKLSNFLNTRKGATAYAFTKTWDAFQTWKWENVFGYMMMGSDVLTNYFYWETYLGTQPGAIYYQIGSSYNSGASQFDGAADPTLIFKASVSF